MLLKRGVIVIEIGIRRARPADAKALTVLSMRSKQSNGYADAFMAACSDELTITPERLLNEEYWVAEFPTICGCVCLTIDADGTSGEVCALFVDPDWKRKGIGSLLWQKVVERARLNGVLNLCLDSDPAAVPFYENLGFKVVGERPSGSIEGRRLPHMTIELNSVA